MTYKLVSHTDDAGKEVSTDSFVSEDKDTVSVQQIAKEAIRTFNKSKKHEPIRLKDTGTEVTVYFVKHAIKHSSDLFLVYEPADNGKKPGKAEIKKADDLVSRYSNSTAVWFTQQPVSEKTMERVERQRAEQKRDRYEKGPKSV
jgi:hypothetical protein